MPIIVGVDPGARTTAIVAVDTKDQTVLGMLLIRNKGPLLPLPTDYLRAIAADVNQLAKQHNADAVHVEGVNRPSWHMGGKSKGAATDPTGLLGAAQVLGAVVATTDLPVHVIPPGRNGSRPMGAYPAPLVSDGERRKQGWQTRVGTGQLRHARSAFDVAMGAAA